MTVVVTRARLDSELVRRGLARSRQQAAELIAQGRVAVRGVQAGKPATVVDRDTPVTVRATDDREWASRGAHKLLGALDAFGDVAVAGRRCLDAGASTGGFTHCLLQRGAEAVVAVDVAYGELHWELRQDPRVTVLERTNARALDCDALPWAPDLLVADLSFISLAKVLPALVRCAAPRFDCLALVKPQFEVGRERVGKGGVVRDPGERRSALVAVGRAAREELGLGVLGYAASGLPGPAGNEESFVWLAEAGRQGAVPDIEAAAREVEP